MITLEDLQAKQEKTLTIEFEHKTLKAKSGQPLKCRQTGKIKTWVTKPGVFKIPVKHGLYRSFYITNIISDPSCNYNDWVIRE